MSGESYLLSGWGTGGLRDLLAQTGQGDVLELSSPD